jgi:hypothetical protein
MVIKSSSLRSRNVREMVTGTGINRWLANFNIFLNGLFGKINTLTSPVKLIATSIILGSSYETFLLRQISAFTMQPAGRIHYPHHRQLSIGSYIRSSSSHSTNKGIDCFCQVMWFHPRFITCRELECDGKSNVNPTHILHTAMCVEDANRKVHLYRHL